MGGRKVEGVVVGGIGMGALMKLRTQGVQVCRALQGTVRDNLEVVRAGRLPRFSSEHACGGHGPEGCGHH
jgi:predicted Fe-Mo cluster-binding NifX family protein